MPENSAKRLNISVKNEFVAIGMKQVSLPNECVYVFCPDTAATRKNRKYFSNPYVDFQPIIKITNKL